VCMTTSTTTSSGTCTDTWCDSVHVLGPPPPVCNFHFTHYSANNPDSVHFYPSVTSTVGYTYLWSFGDGSSSTSIDPWHFYAASGTYYVCLTVTLTTSSGTCTSTICDSVHVTASTPVICNAHFTHYSNTNPDSVHFYPTTSSSSSISYYWNFGDGSSSTDHYPWHFYSSPATYYVCLTVSIPTSWGVCTSTSCDSVHAGQPMSNVHLYPNPSNAYVTIALQNTLHPVSVRIYDMTGNLLIHLPNLGDGSFEISTTNFGDGIYYYVIEDDTEGIARGKLIVLH